MNTTRTLEHGHPVPALRWGCAPHSAGGIGICSALLAPATQLYRAAGGEEDHLLHCFFRTILCREVPSGEVPTGGGDKESA